MKVAVVILNWNGEKLLKQFLPSVVSHSKDLATVYVADNASSDNSLLYVAANFSEVRIIRNDSNGGYAKGYNDALEGLSEDIFILLNSDVEVSQNWISPFINAFEKDPSLVAAQPKILDFQNREYFEYAGAAGGYLDKFGYPYCRGRIFNTLEKDEGQYDDSLPIFWATGACLVVRNDAFNKVGKFDEDLFAHQEEIDLCWRLQAQGGSVKYIGDSAVYHLGGGTLAATNPKKTFYNFRNSLLILLKNNKGGMIWGILFVRLLLDGIAGLQFLIQGKFAHFIAILKAHFSFYSLVPKFLKKRKQWASRTKYYSVTSIVWKYFIRKKRNFNGL